MKHPLLAARNSKFLGFVVLLLLCCRFSPLVAADSTENSFSNREEIEKRLDAAGTELDELPLDADPALRERLEALQAACQYHLAALEFLTVAEEERATARRESSAWGGFAEPPPYSVLLLDTIRESISVLENSRRTSEAQLRIFKTEIEGLRDELSGHQQAERRFMELAEKAAGQEEQGSARKSARMEGLAARVAAVKIGRRQLRIVVMRARMDALVAKQELATRQLNAIGNSTVFSEHEFNELLEQIAREREETARILIEESRTRPAPNPLLTWKIEFLDLKKVFWNKRFAAINSESPEEIRNAVSSFKETLSRVNDWSEISDLRLSGNDPETRDIDPALFRGSTLQLRQFQRLVGNVVIDLEGRKRGKPLLERMGATLQSVWNTEVYLAEQTEIIDGKKVAAYRAITVGKLVRLAGILFVGWFVLRFISRRVNAAVARRGKIPQATADLAGKWAFGTGLVLLLLYGLHHVSIPLTVFAFLGGALAIGVGFGTQTLLKNFISGIILLFERPLKIGDVIEVAGITGTIKLIGIRASVIQHFDGIDTLVPNSILLENQLTNWSFSNPVIRHSVAVGVAYGYPHVRSPDSSSPSLISTVW